MSRHTRCQGAILRDHHLLLIQHQDIDDGHTYRVLPGGGLEDGETEEECIRREMTEETNLDVIVSTLLLDEPGPPDGVYKWIKTYLCDPGEGIASPDKSWDPAIIKAHHIAARTAYPQQAWLSCLSATST